MIDDSSPETDAVIEAPIAIADAEPVVTFIVPASAYDSIATDEELARPLVPFGGSSVAVVEPDFGPTLRSVEELGKTLGEKIDALATRFDREIRAETTREKVVDRLHAELQEYKQDLLLNAMRPIFVDLIQLHDDIGKMAQTYRTGENAEDTARLASYLDGVQQGIEDILYRQGIEPFTHDSDSFDARKQRAVSTIPTDDPNLARKVADRHRKGFLAGEKVIRPEVVSVYLYKAAVTT